MKSAFFPSLFAAAALLCPPARAADAQPPANPAPGPRPNALDVVAQRQPDAPAAKAAGHGVGHKILLYIPNRIFDVFDLVRARVRLGPGVAVGARATKYTDIFMGAYQSVFIGLPGPRQIPRVPWPGGIESRSGLAASVADATVTSYDSNPRYSSTEFGLGLQAILAGAEVGFDPAEVFDLAFGLLFIDFREDDL